jgi:prevent-host-death family protein
MTRTLTQSQAELPRLVERASQGEVVVITVEGKPKALLTRADDTRDGISPVSVDVPAWLNELEALRRGYSTGKPGRTVEEILEEDRADQ